MKQVICYMFTLCLLQYATAQQNIFFKKEKSKYALTLKTTERQRDEQKQLRLPISYYATSQQLKQPYKLYMPKPYTDNNGKDAFLYIIGLGSSILGSIYADKLHYNYMGDYMYPTINYRQNTH